MFSLATRVLGKELIYLLGVIYFFLRSLPWIIFSTWGETLESSDLKIDISLEFFFFRYLSFEVNDFKIRSLIHSCHVTKPFTLHARWCGMWLISVYSLTLPFFLKLIFPLSISNTWTDETDDYQDYSLYSHNCKEHNQIFVWLLLFVDVGSRALIFFLVIIRCLFIWLLVRVRI